MATRSSILAWRIPWTEDPGGLQSIGLHRVRHHCSNLAHMHGTNMTCSRRCCPSLLMHSSMCAKFQWVWLKCSSFFNSCICICGALLKWFLSPISLNKSVPEKVTTGVPSFFFLIYLSKSLASLCSVQFSRSVVSDSLRPHESQHARPPCPSPISPYYLMFYK